METIKKTNIFVQTQRRFVITSGSNRETPHCETCGSSMILAAGAATLFGVSNRIIFRRIEQQQIHFLETDTNEIYVCLTSTTAALEQLACEQAPRSSDPFRDLKGVLKK